MTPQIIAPDYGKHNADLDSAVRRLNLSGAYKDLSTIMMMPAFGTMSTKCAWSLRSIITPPNGRVFPMLIQGMEVGEAFSQGIANLLAHPELAKFKYLFTIEADNICPPDGLIKLLARMEQHPEYACIGGLYWTKGTDGVPQIWGDPKDPMVNYRPQPPRAGELVECVGTGMGCNVWRLDMFKDDRLRKPWFVTKADATGVGTQDLYFWSDARKYGYRCAVDCDVLVGHHDLEGKFGPPDTVW